MTNFYSGCSILAEECILYIDSDLINHVPAGSYSDGTSCYTTDIDGKIIAIGPCTIPCDIAIGFITSTDPTTLGGTNGTITVNFTTSNGPSTYTLNTVAMGAAVSPLLITGLSSNVPYTIEIKDSNDCTITTTATLGQSATLFDADWLQATYEFIDGTDLDTRTRIALPAVVGQDLQSEYLGWGVRGGYDPINGVIDHYYDGALANPLDYLILFGDDNTGNGFESVLVNIKRFKLLFPGESQIVIDLRAFWYNHAGAAPAGNPGAQPVKAALTLWKDASPPVGAPVHNGCDRAGTKYCWTYPTAAFPRDIDSVPFSMNNSAWITTSNTTGGIRIATVKYDLNTLVAVLNNADVTTPAVTGTPF